MSRADVDAFLAQCDDVIEDWEGSVDAAGWAADGSHEPAEIAGDYYLQDGQVAGCQCFACQVMNPNRRRAYVVWSAPAGVAPDADPRDLTQWEPLGYTTDAGPFDTRDEHTIITPEVAAQVAAAWDRVRVRFTVDVSPMVAALTGMREAMTRAMDVDREYQRAAAMDGGYNFRVEPDRSIWSVLPPRPGRGNRVTYGILDEAQLLPSLLWDAAVRTPAPLPARAPVATTDAVIRWALERADEQTRFAPQPVPPEALAADQGPRGTDAQRSPYGPADRRTARRRRLS